MNPDSTPAFFHPSPDLRGQAESVASEFRLRFHREPDWLVAAPGRVNLIGEHTDYNDGFVLPMAIDRYVVMAGGAADGELFRAYSMDLEEKQTFRVGDPGGRKNGDWANYLRGVVDGYHAAGVGEGSLNIVFQSAVPVGGGLSSSAAIEIATATLMEAYSGVRLEGRRKALIAQKAEHDYAGVPCGIMDQFASAYCRPGEVLLLDCRTQEPERIPFAGSDAAVLIVNSNIRHELGEGEYAVRRRQCEEVSGLLGVKSLRDVSVDQLASVGGKVDELLFRRARHVVTETDRTLAAARALSRGEWREAGRLMTASHASLRDDYEVSCPELDLLVDLAVDLGESRGVYGSRMTGGGFGGCTVSLVARDSIDALARAIGGAYFEQTGLEPAIYTSMPARGAHVLQHGDQK